MRGAGRLRRRAALLLSVVGALAVVGPVGNGLIVFSDLDGQGKMQLFSIRSDGSNRQQITTLGENLYPAWSPDGTKLAFVSTQTGNAEIWVMDHDGSDLSQLTFSTMGGNFTPEWSPDGSRIAFASLLDAVGHPEVWVTDADGTNQQRLTFTPTSPSGPTWSLLPTWNPGATKIAYASTISGTTQIWVIDSDGANPVQLSHGNGAAFPDSNAPVWSRDGSEIAFWSGFESQYGEVWVMNADGTNARKLTETIDPRNSDNPSWAPDGTEIIFDSNRAVPPAVAIWIMDADGTNPRSLTSGSGQTSWQPVASSANALPLFPSGVLLATGLLMLMVVMLRRQAPRRWR